MHNKTEADLQAASLLVGDILAASDDEAIAQRVKQEQARRHEERAQRHARGWFLVAELVEMHARQHGWTDEMKDAAYSAARKAAGDGSLLVRPLPEGFPEPTRSWLVWCELADFNEWLVKRKVKPLTLPQATPETANKPASAEPETDAMPLYERKRRARQNKVETERGKFDIEQAEFASYQAQFITIGEITQLIAKGTGDIYSDVCRNTYEALHEFQGLELFCRWDGIENWSPLPNEPIRCSGKYIRKPRAIEIPIFDPLAAALNLVLCDGQPDENIDELFVFRSDIAEQVRNLGFGAIILPSGIIQQGRCNSSVLAMRRSQAVEVFGTLVADAEPSAAAAALEKAQEGRTPSASAAIQAVAALEDEKRRAELVRGIAQAEQEAEERRLDEQWEASSRLRASIAAATKKAQVPSTHAKNPISADTWMLPGDWLPYRARRVINLYELACLLHRQDPERVNITIYHEQAARHRAAGTYIAESMPYLVTGGINLIPEDILGGTVGGTLKALKKATGASTFQLSIATDEARRIAAVLGLMWPPELDSSAAAQAGTTASASPAPAVAVPEAVAAPAEAVPVTPKGVQKREMVRRHAARWPAIKTDMQDAATNGLAAAAKAGERGWREAAALEWAREKSRLLSAPEPGTLDAVMGGGFPSRRHTLAR